MIVAPWLNTYLESTGLLHKYNTTGAKPFIFHPRATSTKAHGPAQWCHLVQRCFSRHSQENVPMPPKNLR